MPVYQLIPQNSDVPSLTIGEKPITIGRSPENVLALDDTLLSRFHCVIEPAPARATNGQTLAVDEIGDAEAATFHLRDLGSRNGTRLNGVKVTDAPLRPGDIIKLGSYSFVVQAEDTLKERQAFAREMADASKAVWVTDLEEMINSIPPRNEGADDAPEMIDGRGKASAALAGGGEGARAVRLLLV
ncbi:MAG TPA: FHA domain-containing protein, partial [Phycisphaerales bacterium]|nr:FHA domain-containing protein [Phycisphaerales bacterium]